MPIDLSSLGWDERLAAGYAPFDRPWLRPGRVAAMSDGVCSVLSAEGVVRAGVGGALLAAAVVDPVALPGPGDWTVLRWWPDRRVTIEVVLPRRTVLVGAVDRLSARRVLAANVDAVAVLEPVDAAPDLDRVGRLLAVARGAGAAPLVVLTGPGIAADVAEAFPGVPVHRVGARSGFGLEGLRPLVAPGRTLGLLGPPGSGRLGLVTALAGMPATGTWAGRRTRSGRRGGHRSATVPGPPALAVLPGGGAVIDIPVDPGAAAAAAPGGQPGPVRLVTLAGGRPVSRGKKLS